MTHPYKLTEEIKQFIIKQKSQNPKLSCRGLIPLIREHFQVSLSKSLINNVVKQNNLSSPKEFILPLKRVTGFIENAGYFFLRAADLELSLTPHLAENLSVYLPNLSQQSLQGAIEALTFMPIFKDRKDLWLFMGKEISLDGIYQYSKQLAQIPLSELNKALTKSGFKCKLNKINELHQQCLEQLSSFVQVNFFPSAYQFLDFPAMQERFYSLWARVKRSSQFLEVQFFYPEGFAWQNDIVWQEDLAYAINRVNEARIFTPLETPIGQQPEMKSLTGFTQGKEQIRINTQVEILPAELI